MKIIDKFFPQFALKQEIARLRLERIKNINSEKTNRGNSRSFEAIEGGRTRFGIASTSKSIDAETAGARGPLREHVRQQEQNSGSTAGPISRIVNNVVGTGFTFQSRVKADEKGNDPPMGAPKINEKDAKKYNNDMERGRIAWAKQADVRLLQNATGLARLAEGALIRDGESLVIGRESKRRHRIIPYCQELVEIDRLQTPNEEISNPKVRGGILFDSEGAPKTYYVLKYHPGESIIGLNIKAQDFEEIPAYNVNGTKKIMHLYNPVRPEQERGFSQFAAALKGTQDMDRYREAYIMAALQEACMTGIVTSENPMGFQQKYTINNPEKENERINEFAPNMIHYLNDFEKFEMHNPTRPNALFGEFMEQMSQDPANALDIPPEVYNQNFKGVNYSNARTILLMFYLTCRVRQMYLTDFYLEPTNENVARALVAHGKVQAPFFDRRLDAYLNFKNIPPGWQWVDPLKEAKGKETEIINDFDSHYNICASKGLDGDEVLEANARFYKRKKDLEEQYEIKFPSTVENAPKEPEETEEPASSKLKVVK